ncbi:MAG TPA: FMN-binding protein [Candidatus Hydrogenedentes bacterium]|mgnify:CR=1 FL=1|nr:FMN-binding protein [Candidatus Hydrogenedentota bacterium]HRK33537.1 FMN-binding protein [Candidatus Hydrogenedentota bacterium]
MSETNNNALQPKSASTWQMLVALGGISLISGVLIVLAYETTLPRILMNRQRAIEEAVFRVLPGSTSRATYAIEGNAVRLLQDATHTGPKIYAGYDDTGALMGIAIEAAGQGYQDVIRVLYGYAPATECSTGFTVIESKETPGLGDKIGLDPRFLANFQGLELRLDESQRSLKNAIVAVKQNSKSNPWEIDGISGATVSSKAVARIVNDSAQEILPIIRQHLRQIETQQ